MKEGTITVTVKDRRLCASFSDYPMPGPPGIIVFDCAFASRQDTREVLAAAIAGLIREYIVNGKLQL